jgi:hypothetical protein
LRIIFYLPEKSLNDATIYYVDLIAKAFAQQNFKVEISNTLDFHCNKTDYILTIRVRDFISAYTRKGFGRVIMWFQGIGPEEYLMINNYSFKAKIISFLFSFFEKITLRLSFFNFFVSNQMKLHYAEKYNYKSKNFCIIPCYNKNLNRSFFNKEIKKDNSFVYAGSLFSWQCFEKTIALYREIENRISDVSLTVLTKEINEANQIISKYDLKNVEVYYVSLDNLDAELSKFKYGFLLRENDAINNVSTPTKMNSYLSVGLMPVYTDVIQSFEENLKLENFEIKLNHSDTILLMADKIQKQISEVDYKKFYDVCFNTFKGYYDDEFNISKIKENLIKIIIKDDSI